MGQDVCTKIKFGYHQLLCSEKLCMALAMWGKKDRKSDFGFYARNQNKAHMLRKEVVIRSATTLRNRRSQVNVLSMFLMRTVITIAAMCRVRPLIWILRRTCHLYVILATKFSKHTCGTPSTWKKEFTKSLQLV